MYDRRMKAFHEQLPKYDYKIGFVDNYSFDNTRDEICKLFQENHKVKGVFNARNFKFNRNVFATMQYGGWDAPIYTIW